MKRLSVFFLSNMLIVLLCSLSIWVFAPYLNILGRYPAVFAWLGLYLGAAFIAFAISKHKAQQLWVAKRLEQAADSEQSWLLATVAKQAYLIGIPKPEVAIYEAVEINAFASGLSKHSALIAVSSSLLQRLPKFEAEAIIAHEMSHIASTDMARLIILQGMANILIVLSAYLIADYFYPHVYSIWVEMGLFIVLTLLGQLLAALAVMYLLRRIEFLADQSGAKLAGTGAMIAALEFLNGGPKQPQMALGMTGSVGSGMKRLFMSHPLLSERILALKLSP
jgi:heat shock protein HtpX